MKAFLLLLAVALLILACPRSLSGRTIRHRGPHRMMAPAAFALARLARKPHFLLGAYPALRAEKDVSLALQNEVADQYGLPRADDDRDADRFLESGYFVRVPERISCLAVDPRLDGRQRLLAQEALAYLRDALAPAYCGNPAPRDRHPLVISSLLRTMAYQRVLARRNPNARMALGDDDPLRRTSHPTGYTFDVSARNLGHAELLRLGALLLDQQEAGMLAIATFEPGQNHFHVMVQPVAPAVP